VSSSLKEDALDPSEARQPRKGTDPRSPIRTLRILELISEAGESMPLAAISQQLSIPKTSTLSLLRPLVSLGYVLQSDGRYRLGPMTYRLMLLASRTPFTRSLRPALEALSRETGETASLCVLDPNRREIEYVEISETDRSVRYVVKPSERRPLYAVSAGLVFLAYQSDEWISDYIDNLSMERFTSSTMASPEQLLRRIEQVRQDGYAVGAGEYSEDVFGFAAPILSRGGSIMAVMVLGGPASRAFANKETYVAKLLKAAHELSAKFGYEPLPG
jgi:IclR family transcriptional regulator, acetate operon repressor